MSKKNIADTYDKLITAVSLINDKLNEELPQFTEAKFLGSFGEEFQNQLSDSGKKILLNLLNQNTLNSESVIIYEEFGKDYQETQDILSENLLATFDLQQSIKKAQDELQNKSTKTKEQLLKDFMQKLSDQGHHFTTSEDETKFKAAYVKSLDKNYIELSNHLGNFKQLPAIFTKSQLHKEFIEAQTEADKSISHTIAKDLKVDDLITKPKPEPKIGLKVDKKNLAEQIQHDIASGKENIDINIISSDKLSLFKKMADIGFQHQNPGLALINIFIFFFFWRDDEKRVFQAIKVAIKENQLFGLDPSKLTLQITSPTPNGNDKIIRKKGPLNPEQIKVLQSMIDENKKDLLTHHHSLQSNKKTGFTPTESGYNTDEEEEIPYSSSPRP